MATERIQIVVSEDGSRTVKRRLEDVGQAGARSAVGVNLLKGALASIGAGLAASQILRLADSYTTVLNRLRLVTSGTENLTAVNNRLLESANRTFASYSATAELYGSLARSTEELGLSQEDLLAITETVNQAIAISGTEAGTAANGLRQLGQGLASGTLRGDELNSVLENMPRLASAIADGMGVTVGELRALGAEGQITARQITDALKQAGPEVAAEFATVNPTIANTFTVLVNNLTAFVGRLNEATGVGAVFGRMILGVANNLDAIAVLAAGVAAAFAWSTISTAVSGVLGPMIALQRALGATSTASALLSLSMKGAQAAVRGFTLALLTNPFTAILVAATAAVAAVLAFGDSVAVSSDGAVTLKDAFIGGLLVIADTVRSVAGGFLELWDATFATVTTLLASFGVSWSDVFDAVWQAVKFVGNGIIGVYAAAFSAVTVAWNNFPGIMDVVFTSVINLAAAAAEAVLNAWQVPLRFIAGGLSLLSDEAGAALSGFLDAATVRVPRARLSAAGQQAGTALLDGIKGAMSRDYVGEFVTSAIERGRTLNGVSDDGSGGGAGLSGTGGGASAIDGANEALESRAEYLKSVADRSSQAAAQARILDADSRRLAESLGEVNDYLSERDWAALSDSEREALTRLLQEEERELRLMQVRDSMLRSMTGPQEDYEDHLEASRRLLAANAISLEDYTNGLLEARAAYLSTRRDAASGLELGRVSVQLQQNDQAGRMARAYSQEWQIANQAMQDLNDSAAALKQLMVDDPVNSGQYAQALREVGVEMLVLKGNMPDATALDGLRAGLASFVQDFRGMVPGLSQAWGSFFTSFADGVANSIGRAIVYGESLGQALRQVAQSALSDLIGSLVRLGIQWLVMQVIGKAAMSSITASSTAAGAATAAAWAPAAAMVSLATFGANAAPAAGAMAIVNGLALGMAALSKATGIAGFRDGGFTGNGGLGQIAGVVHGQEFVVNASATRQWLPFLEAINSGRMPGYRAGGLVGRPVMATTGGGVSASSGGAPLTVVIEDHVGVDIRAERVSPSQVRVIAREVAEATVAERAGDAAASSLARPNSRLSKALSQNTNARRRRD